MSKQNFAINCLSLSAVLLLVGFYFAPQNASGLLTIKDRDYSLVTARTQSNGDALYVLDNRSGRVAVFSYDASAHKLVPRAKGELGELFALPEPARGSFLNTP